MDRILDSITVSLKSLSYDKGIEVVQQNDLIIRRYMLNHLWVKQSQNFLSNDSGKEYLCVYLGRENKARGKMLIGEVR